MERPYYTDEEIETLAVDELRLVSLLPSSPGPVRIERFIEKRFNVVPEYEDLELGILGFTKFGQAGVEQVVLSRALSEEGTQVADRRISSTLAHEGGHMLLHGYLFALKPLAKSESFIKDDVDLKQRTVLCRDSGRQNGTRYDGRWWEYQANRMIGPLLLPRPLVSQALGDLLSPPGHFGTRTLEASRRDEAIRHLASIFDVNPAVARLRLEEIFPVSQHEQLTF